MTGVILASTAWILAWYPALLPLGTLVQGVATGVIAAVGYGVGAAIGASVRLVRPSSPEPMSRWAVVTGVTVPAAAIILSVTRVAALRDQALQMGVSPPAWLLATLIAGGTLGIAVLFARSLRAAARKLAGVLAGKPFHLPTTISRVLGAVIVAAGCWGLLWVAFLGVQACFTSADASTAGQQAPTSPTRSGSQASLISWESLGRQGRMFVTEGPESTIRTFAGLQSATTVDGRAKLAVQDMLRAGGADAEYWVGITTTGNGFVDPVAAAAAEKVGGSTALIAMQYSTLPSWLAFLTQTASAQDAGIALYEALHDAQQGMDPDQRPQLLLYGESLGAFGSAAPFAKMCPQETASTIDGALWVGPPAATQPVTGWTYSGQPVYEPVVDSGRSVRYLAEAGHAPPGTQPWGPHRLLVLQNPTDPVVWFAPKLFVVPARWLDPRGPGVSDAMFWSPLVSGLQTAFSLPSAVSMPSGYGHSYADYLEAAWAEVVRSEGAMNPGAPTSQ